MADTTRMENEKASKTYADIDVVSQGRHIQLIGIGGTIGTALFVQIGSALTEGGPGSLFLGFTLWCTVILAINNCLSEMVTWIPIASPFVRFADTFVDPALSFAAGVNFFVFQAALVPFEVVAFNLVLQFWTDKIPIAAVITFVLIIKPVRCGVVLGFWLATGKVVLAVGLMSFTFVTMVGGNPLHDTYGFRNWDHTKVPGAPFAEHIKTGSLGRFLGFLTCLIQASFTIAGPDYVSMTAGEAELPRRTLPRAFNSVFYRLTTFFVLGSLCVGIVVPYSDANLLKALSDARPGAGSSPYVIAMERLNIPILPHIVNALIMTFDIFRGQQLCVLRQPRNGVPIYSVGVTLAIALLCFQHAAVVLQWFVNLVTASQLLNYAIISFTYLKFYYALKAQGIDRDILPHRSFWQPFARAYYAFTATFVMAFVSGWTVFLPGNWDVPTFLFSYAMLGLAPVLFLFWKVFRRTSWQRPENITFFEKEREEVDMYEDTHVPESPPNLFAKGGGFMFA
ncbi:general amino acid permease AGP2 [Mycena filopes]|nr:general amino acid permease AGP2 [Mycena filopes]